VVNVTALVLSSQNLRSFLLADPSRATGVVLVDKAGKRLANDQANVQRLARVGTHTTAGTFQDYDVVRVLQDDVAGCGVGYCLFQVPNGDILFNHDQLPGGLEGHDLTMVTIGKGGAVAIAVLVAGEQSSDQANRRSKDTGQHVLASPDAYVQVGPAGINVAMKPVK